MASKTTTQNVIQTTSNIGAAQLPYYNTAMQGAQSLLRTPFAVYDKDRLEGFTQQQQKLQGEVAGMQTPGQFGTGSQLATTAGLGALQAGQYNAGQFNSQQIGMPNLQQYSMQGPRNVYAQQYSTPQMQAAQTGFKPNLNYFQMQQPGNVQGSNVQSQDMQAAQTTYGQGPLEQFRMDAPQQFGGVQAQQYMSPFAESVMEPQKREAIRSAKQSQLVQDLGAARQGTYGGSRQLLAGLERERNLGQQLGDIDARGRQAAFENAQQQFERDRAAGMTAGRENLQAALGQQQLGVTTGLQPALANLDKEQQARVNNQAQQFQAQGMNAEQSMRAALANQQAGLTTGQQNLSANLQTQQLATDTDLRASLANLDAASQANVQNLAAQLQQQGLNQQQAMQAALANQQAQLTTGQQNLQAALDTQRLGAQTGLAALQSNQQSDLERQRMAEQSRQFGAQQGLAGLAQANQSAQTLANIGQTQQNADLARLGMQQGTAAQQQAFGQQMRDLDYSDFMRETDYPYTQLQRYMSLLSGVPQATTSTRTESAPSPSVGQQLLGAGVTAAGLYKQFGT